MQEREALLPGIRTPQDLKHFNYSGLARLAKEIRDLIVSVVNVNGGHLASNLGVVELTIALHLVFDSPDDKIVWDVGHQCYAHKILTGRYAAFSSLRKSGGIAGFPKTSENSHDSFNTGHASTSVSAALGILAAEKINRTDRRAAAVIGDGALTGGLAFEALSHAGQLALPLVLVLNDNKMSIGPNVGGLSKYLSRLSMKGRYQKFRRTFDSFVKKIPLFGEVLFKIVLRLKRAVKAVFYTDNFFVDLGFEYVGPIEGHNIPLLVQVLSDAKNLNKPVVVHVITRKGKGYPSAEDNPGAYHGVPASRPKTAAGQGAETFTRVFGAAVLEEGGRNEKLAVISAAMEEGTGLSPFKKAFPGRFFDVGIAEEHAVTFAAGLAANGARPLVAVYSTFIQRGTDQLIHDVCLQNLPVVFALDRSGLVGDDGETHQGIFDISLFRSAPNMTLLAPAGKEEFILMLKWALSDEGAGPVMIRYPKAACPEGDPAFSLPVEKGRGVWAARGGNDALKRRARQGNGGSLCAESGGPVCGRSGAPDQGGVCIAFTGGLYPQVKEAAALLESSGVKADLYNLRFLKPLDEDYFAEIMRRYEYLVLVEEGSRSGGFGEYAASLALRKNVSCRLLVLGVKEEFDALGTREELLRRNGLDAESIAASVSGLLAREEAP